MKKFLGILSAVLVVALIAAVFAACGSKTDDTTTAPGETTTEAPKTQAVKVIDIDLSEEQYAFGVDKAQPELLAKVNEFIAKIKADGTFDSICNNYFGDGTPVPVTSAVEDASKDQLIVATNAAFEPFESTDGDKYIGIDMEIAAKLAEFLGKELVINNMNFESVCLSVGQHKCDIAMAGLTVKPEREEFVTFSDSYYSASQKLIVKGDNVMFDACADKAAVETILNTFDASTKIGVQNGTTGQLYVEGDAEMGFAGLKATCAGYSNGSLAVQDLINGNVSYVIIDSAPATAITNSINALQ